MRTHRILTAVVLTTGLTAAIGLRAAHAGTVAEQIGGQISVDLRAAADVAPTLDLRLIVTGGALDGTDVTDTKCSAPPGGDLECVELDDSVYRIDIVGDLSGLFVSVQCVDIVAASATEPIIDIAGGFTNWSCNVYVGSPTVLLSINSTSGRPAPPGVDVALVPEPADCFADTHNSGSATRCRGLTDGVYTVETTGTDETMLVSEASCGSIVDPNPLLTAQATISPAQWLWWCDVGVDGRARVTVNPRTADALVPDGLAPVVSGPDGDVSERCVTVFESAEFGAEYECFLPDGAYSVDFPALADQPGVEACAGFTLETDQDSVVFCEWSLTAPPPSTAPPTTAPATTSPPTTQPVVTELPRTGGTVEAALLASIAALVAGAALVLAARRRLPTG